MHKVGTDWNLSTLLPQIPGLGVLTFGIPSRTLLWHLNQTEMLACKSHSAAWEYWGLLQGKEHVKSSLINQCLGTDGMAIWALITVSWDRGSQTLMRFNKMNDYTSITIRETCKMSWIIMATSHKTGERTKPNRSCRSLERKGFWIQAGSLSCNGFTVRARFWRWGFAGLRCWAKPRFGTQVTQNSEK